MRYALTLTAIGTLLGVGLVLHPGDAQTMGNGIGNDAVTIERDN